MTLPRIWTLFGADHLPYRLLLLARMIDRQASRQLQSQFDLTLAEWRVLAYICAAGPQAATNIGQSSGIDRAEISRAVAKLEKKELAQRKQDPDNRRRLIIRATDAGQQLFLAVRDDRRSFFRALLEPIAEADRAVIERSLEQMARQIEQIAPGLD